MQVDQLLLNIASPHSQPSEGQVDQQLINFATLQVTCYLTVTQQVDPFPNMTFYSTVDQLCDSGRLMRAESWGLALRAAEGRTQS